MALVHLVQMVLKFCGRLADHMGGWENNLVVTKSSRRQGHALIENNSNKKGRK
jgi:hypothetical protein